MKDSTIIYESAYLAINYLPDDALKWEAMEGLLRYGFYGELPQSDNPFINMIYVQALPVMQNARQRYENAVENGRKGGRPTAISTEEIMKMKQENMTNKQIADKLGCSVKNIESRITAYNKTHPNNPNNLSVSVSVSDTVSSSVSGVGLEGREIKDLRKEEGEEIVEKIRNRVKYTDIQTEYGLKERITKDFQKLWEQELFTRSKTEREQEIKNNKSKYEFLQKFWELDSIDAATQRAKAFLSKYPVWTLEQLTNMLCSHDGLDLQTYNATIDKISAYDWSTQEYKNKPSVFYIDWLNEKMCELSSEREMQ